MKKKLLLFTVFVLCLLCLTLAGCTARTPDYYDDDNKLERSTTKEPWLSGLTYNEIQQRLEFNYDGAVTSPHLEDRQACATMVIVYQNELILRELRK